jgi:hypothetical protein
MSVIYNSGDDLVLRLRFNLDGLGIISPIAVPFVAKIWTADKDTCIRAGYNGSSFFGGASVENETDIVIHADISGWFSGVLHGEVTFYYPDALIEDNEYAHSSPIVFSVVTEAGVDVTLGSVTHTVYGLSAYDLAVKNGFSGTEEEWLASLKQPAIDAANYAIDIANHAMIVGDNGNLWNWNTKTRKYEDTGKRAQGAVFARLEINSENELVEHCFSQYTGEDFFINENGELVFNALIM